MHESRNGDRSERGRREGTHRNSNTQESSLTPAGELPTGTTYTQTYQSNIRDHKEKPTDENVLTSDGDAADGQNNNKTEENRSVGGGPGNVSRYF